MYGVCKAGVVLLGLVNGGTAAMHQPIKLYIHGRGRGAVQKEFFGTLHRDQSRAALMPTEMQKWSWQSQKLTQLLSVTQKACVS